jgi:hypothetical protein
MLIRQETLARIASGAVTLQFRRWRKPTVKAGGTLRTAVGVLSIEDVCVVDESALTLRDARAAGCESVEALREVFAGREGTLYRVTLRYAGDDPREALRQKVPGPHEIDEILARLARFDRSAEIPWTARTLEQIAREPGRRAPDFAAVQGLPVPKFKRRVRQLKELGLTESLEVGYRLSPRGEVVHRALGERRRS